MKPKYRTLEDLLRELDGLEVEELLFLWEHHLNSESLQIMSNSLGSRALNRRFWAVLKDRQKLGFNFAHSSFKKTSGYPFI